MEEIDLKELIQMFYAKKLLICLIIIISGLMGAIYTLKLITPIYESSTSLVLVQSKQDSTQPKDSITTSDLTLNSQLVADYREVAVSRSVLSRVIDNLGLEDSYEQLKEEVAVSAISDTELIKITVSDPDPEKACRLANEIALIFIDKVNDLYKVDNIHVLDEALVDYEPCNINLTKNVVIAIFIGLVAVSGYILMINMLDTTVKTDTDIERNLAVPVLASIIMTGDGQASKRKRKSISSSSSRVEAEIAHTASSSRSNSREDIDIIDNDVEDVDFKDPYEDKKEEAVSLFNYVSEEDGQDNLRNTRPTRSSRPSVYDNRNSSALNGISSSQIPTRRRKGGKR